VQSKQSRAARARAWRRVRAMQRRGSG